MDKDTPPLARVVDGLRERKGWTDAELLRRSGNLAATTLARLREGKGGRADALKKLDDGLGLRPGTLSSVKRGERTPEDVLEEADTEGGLDALYSGVTRRLRDAPPERLRAVDAFLDAFEEEEDR